MAGQLLASRWTCADRREVCAGESSTDAGIYGRFKSWDWSLLRLIELASQLAAEPASRPARQPTSLANLGRQAGSRPASQPKRNLPTKIIPTKIA